MFLKKHPSLIIVIIIFLCLGGVIIHKIVSPEDVPLIETPQTEMNTVPPDVAKEIILPSTATPSATIRVPILMYHYVEYITDKRDTFRQSLNVNPIIFEAQIKTLISAGYNFMTAKDLGDVIDGKTPLPPKPVLLTFDDGHWDLATVVLPLLEKYHIKATAYIIPGFIGRSDFLSKKQLDEVMASGLVDIGAHTVHHISLKGKKLATVIAEIDGSQTMLENMYHLPVVSFAYPNGAFDKQAISVVRSAGFTTAVSTVPGIVQSVQNRFYLYRLRPGGRTGQVLLTFLSKNNFTPLQTHKK